MNVPKIFTATAAAMILFGGSANVSAETVISAEANASVKITVKKSVDEYASAAQGIYTGLVIDCRGLGLQPVMSPIVKNVNGTKIYGHKNLDVDRVIREGMVDYILDTANVDRAGVNPLVVRAIALEDFNSTPVVSIVDSNRILIENRATKFLQDLKVVFLY